MNSLTFHAVCAAPKVLQNYNDLGLKGIIIRSIICTRHEELGNEGRFPEVIATVQCSVCSQQNNINNKPRVVVTDAPYVLDLQ